MLSLAKPNKKLGIQLALGIALTLICATLAMGSDGPRPRRVILKPGYMHGERIPLETLEALDKAKLEITSRFTERFEDVEMPVNLGEKSMEVLELLTGEQHEGYECKMYLKSLDAVAKDKFRHKVHTSYASWIQNFILLSDKSLEGNYQLKFASESQLYDDERMIEVRLDFQDNDRVESIGCEFYRGYTDLQELTSLLGKIGITLSL